MTKSFREPIGAQPSRASTQDSVLLIIDAQNEYAEGELKAADVGSTRAKISELLDKYRAASAPSVHIVHKDPGRGSALHPPGTSLAAEFQRARRSKQGRKGHCQAVPGQLLGGRDLDAFLQGTGRQKACVDGIAAEKGYDVLIAEDAVGDRDIPGVKAEELKKTVLAQLADYAGTVVNSAEIR